MHRPPRAPHEDLGSLRSTLKMLISGDRFESKINLAAATQPVLVIHAFIQPRTDSPLENALVRDGFHVFRFCLGPAHFMGIEETARIMSEKLKDLRTRAIPTGIGGA